MTRLKFKLPENVTCHIKSDALFLVRNFPLKSLKLHASWNNLFETFANTEFLDMTTIQSHCPDVKSDRLELFLYDLARKGFLEHKGTSIIRGNPFVSIIIPVYNRPDEIKDCLESLKPLDYPADCFEVIVIDDASSDHTPDVIKSFNVRLISLKQNKQASYCRNLGANHANGEILAFIDSDCTADPSWLNQLVTAFNDPAVGAVGGRIDSFFNDSDLDRYEQVNSSLIIGKHIKRSRDEDRSFYVPSCNLLIQKKLFVKIGGFNRNLVLGEDVDLCWRIQDVGRKVEFRPDGVIFHRHRNKISAFCKRRFEYGTSEPLLQTLHKNRKKQFFFPLGSFIFWFLFILALLLPLNLLLFLCPVCLVIDTITRRSKLIKENVPASFYLQIKAMLRSYAALFYHCSTFISRYYLVFVLFSFFIFPKTAGILFFLHLTAGLVAWKIKKPLLNPVSFLFYFSLEQISYQIGVWTGVFKQRTFSPINPVVIFRR